MTTNRGRKALLLALSTAAVAGAALGGGSAVAAEPDAEDVLCR